MKKIVDKLKVKAKANKKMIIFLVSLMLAGILAGSIFVVILSKNDQNMLKEYLDTFITNIDTGKLDYINSLCSSLGANVIYVLVIWLLGISVIGIPVTLFMFFSKAFILGFSISSIIMNYQLKGCLVAFFYIFPHHVINMILYIVLMLYSLTVSLKIIKSMLKKEPFDFRKIVHKYSFILLLSIIGVMITTLMEIYVVPTILKEIVPILK